MVPALGPSGFKWGEALKPSNKFLAYVLVSALIVILTTGLGDARQGGIDEELAQEIGGSIEVGCTCHNPDESTLVRAVLLGVPANYALEDARPYNLTVRIEGELVGEGGGFNLHVSDGVLTADDPAVQITDLGDATHTNLGVNQVEWNMSWVPPAETEEAVLFRLTVNSVNGNLAPDPEDLWARTFAVAAGTEPVAIGAAADPLHIESLGVNWLAYWVGIVSFAFMIVILILYYFVFRYSETSNATDHRDRKKK